MLIHRSERRCVNTEPTQIKSNLVLNASREKSVSEYIGMAPDVFAQKLTPAASTSAAISKASGKSAARLRKTRPCPQPKSKIDIGDLLAALSNARRTQNSAEYP